MLFFIRALCRMTRAGGTLGIVLILRLTVIEFVRCAGARLIAMHVVGALVVHRCFVATESLQKIASEGGTRGMAKSLPKDTSKPLSINAKSTTATNGVKSPDDENKKGSVKPVVKIRLVMRPDEYYMRSIVNRMRHVMCYCFVCVRLNETT